MQGKGFLPQPGEMLLDRFLLQEIVGVGPISGVYRARDEALGKDLVLKYLYPGLSGPQLRETNLFRLYRARGFLHKNILAVHEVFSDGGHFFLTKDIVDGISLRALQKLRQENLEPFNKREIVQLLFEICEALRWVHMLGANGNLKPENIILTDAGLKVDDPYFLVGRTSIPAEHGSFPLADRYLAPEQLEDEVQERKESDIYALALILGEVLVGKPVRPGIPLSDQGPFFSPELDDVYLKATSASPADRHASVSLFWDGVRQVFRVPAEDFTGERPPVAFIPESLSKVVADFRAYDRPETDTPPATEEPEPEMEVVIEVEEEPREVPLEIRVGQMVADSSADEALSTEELEAEATLPDVHLSEEMAAEAEEGLIVIDDTRSPAMETGAPEAGGEEEAELSEEPAELVGEIDNVIEETRDLEGFGTDEDYARPAAEEADPDGGEAGAASTLIFDSLKTMEALEDDEADIEVEGILI